ncbi:unnamed protein product [Urochloa humidicola]
MDRQQHHAGGGVKVTYIETRFVTSDAAGFKDLVQRLTGRSPAAAAPAPAAPPHRPRACGAGGGTGRAAAAGPQGYDYRRRQAAGEVRCPAAAAASGAPPCVQDEMLLLGMMDDDFSDLFYVGASDQWRASWAQ